MAVVEKLEGQQSAVSSPIPWSAAIAAALGLGAGWFAAGSSGFVPDGLRNALAWLLLVVAMLLLWTNRTRGLIVKRGWPVGIVLCGVSLGGLIVTAFNQPVASTAAVAALLAALAAAQIGQGRQPLLLAASAAFMLAIYRFAATSIASVWFAADTIGGALGTLAGRMTGQPLDVGQTFAGLDFLVVMAYVYVGWLLVMPRPRRLRAVWALAAIIASHLLYLIALGCNDLLAGLLPPVTEPPEADISYVGLSTWGNALRALLPWNLPLVAVVLHAAVAAVLFRRIPLERLAAAPGAMVSSNRPSQVDELFYWGPAVLAVALPIISLLSLSATTLGGKKVVAYERGRLSWSKPVYGEPDLPARAYGMLPFLVEMLGGNFFRSAELSAADLAKADVLLLIHPDRPWSDDQLERIEQYVRSGGSVLIAAEPPVLAGERRSRFDEPLATTGIAVREQATAPAAAVWEQSLRTCAHPTTALRAGRGNRFGLVHAAGLDARWPAFPLLVGQYGCSVSGDGQVADQTGYQGGARLGDLPLAVEQRLGAGRIVVLSDTTALSNDGLVSSYEFTGRLFSYLADKSAASPQNLWRQVLALLAVLAIVVLAVLRPHPLQCGAAAAALAVAWLVCAAISVHATRVVPDGGVRKGKPNMLAYIDASHLEAYSDAPGSQFGIDRFARTLMRNGYLPLLLGEMTAERLEKAHLFITVAPSRPFSAGEMEMTDLLTSRGGAFVCTVGAEEVGPCEPLLEHYDVHVAQTPVRPGTVAYEPWPIGKFWQTFDSEDATKLVGFYAGWPLDVKPGAEPLVVWVPTGRKEERPVAAVCSRGQGMAVAVADTYFIANGNMLPDQNGRITNEDFWPWLLEMANRPAPARAGRPKSIDPDMPIDPDSDGGSP